MKVLQIHAGYRTPAGEDTVVHAEAAALRRAGHDVHQAIEQNPDGTVDALRALARSTYNRRSAERVAQVVRRLEPDVAHVHNTWFTQTSAVVDAVADADVPIVMTLHNYRLGCLGVDLFREGGVCTSCVGRTPLAGVRHGCYRNSRAVSAVMAVEVMSTRRRSTLDRVDRFVAPSEFMADRLVEIGVPSDRLTVKPHFTADPGVRTQRPSASNEVLFIGRLASAKGLLTLLRAWERAVDRHRALGDDEPVLTIIGDGPLAAEARESAPRNVDFAGWLSHAEVQQRMLGARAFVFPSEWYEPFGMVLIEAMAAGLPVVASTASDAARITATPPELVAAAGDDRAFAASLLHLTDDVVDEVGAASRRRFETRYSERVGVADQVSLYESVIAAHPSAIPATVVGERPAIGVGR